MMLTCTILGAALMVAALEAPPATVRMAPKVYV